MHPICGQERKPFLLLPLRSFPFYHAYCSVMFQGTMCVRATGNGLVMLSSSKDDKSCHLMSQRSDTSTVLKWSAEDA